MPHNLLLTGDKHIGKSTLLKRLLEEYPALRRGGFVTLPAPPGHRFKLLDLNPAADNRPDRLICRQISERGYEGIAETFETRGVQSLERCLPGEVDCIVMDELGSFESQAAHFQALVHTCLDSPLPVLGVLKQKSHPFLNSIHAREDVKIFTITLENRDTIFDELRAELKQILSP